MFSVLMGVFDMITIDFETRSFANLSKPNDVGTYKYSCDPTTTVLCMGYKIDDRPTQLWAPWGYTATRGYTLEDIRTKKIMPPPQMDMSDLGPDESMHPMYEFRERVKSGDKLVAHKAFFERCIWENQLVPIGWPKVRPDQWVCSMAAAQAYGLPGALDLAAKVMRLKAQKGNQRAMRRMMKPRSAWLKTGKGDIWFGTEQDYQELCDYCILDVEVEYELYSKIDALSPREREIWLLDQKMNMRGVRVDRELAEGAWKLFDTKRQAGAASLIELTGGAVETPGQTGKLVKWVESQGVGMENCQGPTVNGLVENPDTPELVRDVLKIRQSVGGAAELKYKSFLDHITEDNQLRGELIYHGAHTGRWTSKGVQLHNAVKNKMDVEEAEVFIECVRAAGVEKECFDYLTDFDNTALLTTLVRSCVVAPPGKTFIDLDYSSIEARVIAWLAGEEELLSAFRSGTPVYEQMAAEIFQIPISKVTKQQRALGKVAVLGLGYGMGADMFYTTCVNWGVKIITPELAERAKNVYRKKFKKIVKYWYDFEKHIKATVRTGQPRRFGSALIMYDPKKLLLSISLPNGRWMHYHQCIIKEGSIQYFGRFKPPKSGYGIISSWGGKFTENQDQALSRDYMALAMVALEKMPEVAVVLTIHDELLLQVPIDRVDELMPEIQRRTTPSPRWADGLPVDTGHWVGPRFRKD